MDTSAPIQSTTGPNTLWWAGHLSGKWAAIVTSMLLLVFAVLSYSAVLTKCATCDEPLHLVGGMVHRYLWDYRINPEDPPLLGFWARLPVAADAMPLDTANQSYQNAQLDINEVPAFLQSALFADGVKSAQIVNRSRVMFLIVGLLLGALLARWAYELAGGWASVIATALYCLNPTVLGHAPLIKNDVPLTLVMFALGYVLWRFCKSGSAAWLILAGLCCAIGINVKFSGILLLFMLGATLAARILMPASLSVSGIKLDSWGRRVALVGVGCAMTIVLAWVMIWTVYGFRYEGTADAKPLNFKGMVLTAAINARKIEMADHEGPPMSYEDIRQLAVEDAQHNELSLAVKSILFLRGGRLLPEGWLWGFLYTYVTTLVRKAYLLGATRETGWWYYFPLAILFKTPVATLVAVIVAPVVWLATRGVRKSASSRGNQYPLIIAIPPVIYFAVALTTNLNLGIRHVLPVFPYVFLGVGVAAAALWGHFPRQSALCGGLVLLMLSLETLSAYPNYIAYFNSPSGGIRGGFRLLGDSNLDWGQDLPALAQWQKKHPGVRIYLSYFGSSDPQAYGVNCVCLPGGWNYRNPVLGFTDPGVIAVSASNLQALLWEDDEILQFLGAINPAAKQRIEAIEDVQERRQAAAKALLNARPDQVLNGTIFLFPWPPRQ